MVEFSRFILWETVTSSGERIGLSFSFVLFIFLALMMTLLLRYTLLGRSLYAIGGNYGAAQRAGFNYTFLQFVLYG